MTLRSGGYRIWIAAISSLMFVSTACGPAGASPSATGGTASAAPGATTLAGAECPKDTAVTFWTSHTPPDVDSLKNIVDAFNKQSGGKPCVTMVKVPGSETDVAKLNLAVRGGTGPDVYMLDRFTVAERAAAGLLTELTQAGSWKDKNLEFAWEETQYKGKTYALPFDTDARALFYNIDLLKASGVDQATIDSLDAKNGPVTLDEIRQIANKVDKKDANGAYTTLGFMPWPSPSGGQNQGWHYTWGFAWGGQFADIAACKVTPTEQPIVDAFQWMYDWAKDHGPQQLATWFSTYSPPNNPAAQDPFVTGKLAMTIVGDWRIAEMKQYAPNVNYGITWIPVPKKGMESVTWAGGWSMVIPTGAKHPDDAWKFLEYIDGDPGQAIYTKETAHLPTVKSLLTDQSLYEERHKFFLDLLKVAKSRPVLPVGALYWDALTRAQQAVVTNTQTPKEALQAAENSVQPRLQRFCPLT